jgi:hypothetical protein
MPLSRRSNGGGARREDVRIPLAHQASEARDDVKIDRVEQTHRPQRLQPFDDAGGGVGVLGL